jgi:preprotein translocase subunit YajC
LNFVTALLAQAAGPTTAPASQPGAQPPALFQFLSSPMMPLLLAIAVLYIFMFRNKGNEKKQREQMLSALKRGDRVQTIGGVLGTVVEAREADVLLKVDESSNTKIRFARSAIHRVIEEEKAESK